MKQVVLDSYNNGGEKMQVLHYLCANVPADKLDIVLNLIGNLIKGSDGVSQIVITRAAEEAITKSYKDNDLKSVAELLAYFLEGKKFVIPYEEGGDIILNIQSFENTIVVFNLIDNTIVAKFQLQQPKLG